jgi:hypothetical protein
MLINKLQVLYKDRFYIAAILSSLSIIVAFGAYLLYSSPFQEPKYEQKKLADMKSCVAFSEHKGLTVEQDGKSVLVITKSGFDEPKFTFSMIEAVILACDNIEFKSFCMGVESQCGIDGTKVVLTYENPKVY